MPGLRDLFVLVTVLVSVPTALVRPWIGILVFLWLGFMNPHKLAWGFVKGLPVAMLVGGATLLGLLFTRDRRSVPWTPELGLVAVLGVYFTFTTFFAWAPEEAWAQWEKVMKIFVMTFVMTMLIFGRQRIHVLLMMAALSIGFFGFKGGIFSITGGGHSQVLGPEGTFIEGNTFIGLAMVMVLPLLIFLAREEARTWVRRGLYLTAGLTVVAIVFTYSRGALVGLAAVVPLIFLKSKNKILLVLILIPMAYGIMSFAPDALTDRAETIETYDQDRSAMQRIQAWSVAWNVAKDYPLTGAGFEFEYADDEQRWLSYADRAYDQFGEVARAAHSLYFQVLGQHGLVAFCLFLLMLFFTYRTLYRLVRDSRKYPDTAWIANYAAAVQVGMIGYLAAGAFLNSAYFDLFYLFMGAAAILRRELLLAHPVVAKPWLAHRDPGAVTASAARPAINVHRRF